MDITSFLVSMALIVILIYSIVIYNNLVRLRHNVSQAWSNIQVLLKQRHDELPKLVETCKQHMAFEQETLERVMHARAEVAAAQQRGDVTALGAAEQQLRLGLGNLFAVAEAYPELRANESFQQLHHRISTLENSIADRREYYNDSVNNYNIRIEQFPDVILARLLHFQPKVLLHFGEQELADPDMKALFSRG